MKLYYYYSPKRAPKANPAINDGMEPLINECVSRNQIKATSGCITNSVNKYLFHSPALKYP